MAKEMNSPLSEVAQSPKITTLVEDSANYDLFRSGSSTRSSRSNTAYLSSPDLGPVDPRTPILEEEEDELFSDAVDEPTTPADDGSEQDLGDPLKSLRSGSILNIDILPPVILNTLPTPGKVRATTDSDKSPEHVRTPTRTQSRSKRSSLRRSVSNLFKRTNSQHGTSLAPMNQSLRRSSRSDPSTREHSPMSRRYTSGTTSPNTTRPASPSLPGTPDNGLCGAQTPVNFPEPDSDSSPTRKRKTRSSTGFSLREALHLHSPKKISFMPDEKFNLAQRNRASSADSYADPRIRKTSSPNPDILALQQHMWGMNASSGVGLKARRLSQNIPDDFNVFPTELYDDYSDQSKLPGRRGKTLGEGATANVKLMTGKDSPNDLYAVKEFRRKGKKELTIDYEKKVKSEFSIAKSVQHPNIVKTFSLCTHNGRWNHVMEFCEQGDLFSLVQKHYLSHDQHLKDRLCLFKQLVQGIHYLHEHGIAHRDIKLENLLITDQGHLKITDFGVSEVFSGIHPGLRSAEGQCGKEMDDEVRLCTPGICGSPPYIAPEVISKQGDYDPRPIDVWSAAIVMISMTANGTLWNEARPGSSAVYDSLISGWAKWDAKHESCSDQHDITESDYPHIPFFDNFINPPALRRILLTMLNPDPNKRVSMHEVANNRWLKNVECCQLDVLDEETHGGFDAKRVSSCGKGATKMKKIQHPHNHLPPPTSLGHRLVRLPGSTEV